jgi:hypothetical protein
MIRNLKKICKKYKKAEIYFHQDLDGVASGILMRKHLERYGIEVVDAHTIQYGEREWSMPVPKQDSMPVLVDFAHGKTMFVIHTDHHDRQVGHKKTDSTFFKAARSNAETLDNIPIQYFPSIDMEIIRTIDSANFLEHGIKPRQVRNFIINGKFSGDTKKDHWLVGLAANKLLLAFKNKPHFLKGLVLGSEPSLFGIYVRALELSKRLGYEKPAEMQLNGDMYRNRMKKYENLQYDARYKIITQFGGGFMFKRGSYDRYVVFENHPLSEFLVQIWPMGLVQAACNPFRPDRLEGINLGDIANNILQKHKISLSNIMISLADIKYENETRIIKERNNANKYGYKPIERLGFMTDDLIAIYSEVLWIYKDNKYKKYDYSKKPEIIEKMRPFFDKNERTLTSYEKRILSKVYISAYDLINLNSGGHASITNLSGFNYLKWNPTDTNKYYGTTRFTDVMRQFGDEIRNLLIEKIKQSDHTEQNIIDQNWSMYQV